MRTVLKATCGKHSKEISVSQITHFVAEDKYVIAYYADGFLLLRDTIRELETEFSDEFIRTHRKAPGSPVSDQHVQAPARRYPGRRSAAARNRELDTCQPQPLSADQIGDGCVRAMPCTSKKMSSRSSSTRR